ncbi:hypothetical protein QBC39DRAFT_412785, partial [Podospora conica]
LPPQRGDVYRLARACKGFWKCLHPLLYQVDVALPVALSDSLRPICVSTMDWFIPGHHSALSWGIDHGQMATVKLAIEAARSMGKLEIYASVNCRLKNLPAHPDIPNKELHARGCCPAWVEYFGELTAGALCQAILRGNTAAVELITEGADALMLNRPLHVLQSDPTWVSYMCCIHLANQTGIQMTPLDIAIMLGHVDIVEVLLTRFSQLDQTTLEWYEPTAMQTAAFIGDVDMARLILDGTSLDKHSPWTTRARSQLVDPRAYGLEAGSHTSKARPPMILAAAGMYRAGRRQKGLGDEIFWFLAARGGQHLLAQPFNWVGKQSQTPLEHALAHNFDGRFMYPPEHFENNQPPRKASRIVALIRAGALNTRSPISSTRIFSHPGARSVFKLWGWFENHAEWNENWGLRLKFMGDCWDAALEHHGGMDDELVNFWGNALKIILPSPITSIQMERASQQEFSEKIDTLEKHVALISTLESKCPGFAQQPTIRSWLDNCVFQESSPHGINHSSLKNDYSHLMG